MSVKIERLINPGWHSAHVKTNHELRDGLDVRTNTFGITE